MNPLKKLQWSLALIAVSTFSASAFSNNATTDTSTSTLKVEDIKQDLTIVTMDELVEKGVTLPLVNLFFDTDKYDIKPASFAELDRLASIVKDNNHAIEIRGHTDDVGTEEYNLNLSEKRAQAVRTYLIQKGCSSDKITAKGYGEKKPEDSNQTMQGRAKNRRVEVRFIN